MMLIIKLINKLFDMVVLIIFGLIAAVMLGAYCIYVTPILLADGVDPLLVMILPIVTYGWFVGYLEARKEREERLN